jgi:hypothetical protein
MKTSYFGYFLSIVAGVMFVNGNFVSGAVLFVLGIFFSFIGAKDE